MSIPSWAKRIYRRVREQFLRIPETPRSLIVSALFLCGAYLASGILINHTGGENNSALVFVLAVVMISLLTEGYAYGIVSSIIGGFCINFFFNHGFVTLHFMKFLLSVLNLLIQCL